MHNFITLALKLNLVGETLQIYYECSANNTFKWLHLCIWYMGFDSSRTRRN